MPSARALREARASTRLKRDPAGATRKLSPWSQNVCLNTNVQPHDRAHLEALGLQQHLSWLRNKFNGLSLKHTPTAR